MDNLNNTRLNLQAIRERLAGKRGQQYWRSLEEVAETEEFRRYLDDEFPNRAGLLEIDRRQFVKFLGASLALAGLSGCRVLPQRQIVPYVEQPEDEVPGKPLFYATAWPFRGYGTGLLAESHEGRPTKLEGNPDHPASLGSTNAFAQAEILQMYDPDRGQGVVNMGTESTWEAFVAAARPVLQKQVASGGAGIRILTETVTSPTLAEQIAAFRRRFPAAQWHVYEPLHRDNERAALRALLGRDADAVYHFDRAAVVLPLDSDFLLTMPGSVRYAREFGDRRRVRATTKAMNRLYAVESTCSITGAMADHRLPVRPGQVEAFARALSSEMGSGGPTAGPVEGVSPEWIAALARDLRAHTGEAVVVAGDEQTPAVHALAHSLNAALGAVGKTVTYHAPVDANPAGRVASLQQLVDDVDAGRVEVLLVLGGNPVFAGPADLGLREKLLASGPDGRDRVPFRVHLGLYADETSEVCHWHLPEAHFLEAWGDIRAHDGTVSIVQPLIEPIFHGKSAIEVLALLMDEPLAGYDLVRRHWQRARPSANFDATWQRWLNDGLVRGTSTAPMALPAGGRGADGGFAPAAPPAAGTVDLVFRPDPTILDGRYANNGWLQELPKPLTKVAWDNPALISPAMAQRLGVSMGGDQADMLEIEYAGRRLTIPAFILPGIPDNTVTLTLGYGGTRTGRVGAGTGFDTYSLRTAGAMGFASGATVRRVPGTYTLVSTQYHDSMVTHGRDLVHSGTLQQFVQEPARLGTAEEPEPGPDDTIFPAPRDHANYDGYAWAMAIDNNVCIGCNACVTACQSENNIPVVGKDQVLRGREMHWLRIDRYYQGGMENPTTLFQPVPCMHCEKAPCEPVCPVGATVHSHEGLNQMVYNRCVGTRYCSNNCPYKVRRFNFYKYTAGQPNHPGTNYDLPSLKLMANPDVTVRGRGVMEKCTYCVQRINQARIESKIEGRPVRDGEIVTACQQACPTSAITFGDKNNANTKVAGLRAEPHSYGLLAELGTRPRTTYLAKLRNPNPEIEPPSATKAE